MVEQNSEFPIEGLERLAEELQEEIRQEVAALPPEEKARLDEFTRQVREAEGKEIAKSQALVWDRIEVEIYQGQPRPEEPTNE